MNQNQSNKQFVKFSGLAIAGVMLVGCSTDKSSMTDFFPADLVVVAADAFRTPQLLWASGIRPRTSRSGSPLQYARSASLASTWPAA